MSTTLNQRKKRGGAVWTEEFYTKGKKQGQKVPGFGMSKAQFTKEGVARKSRKTRSKIGEVDKEAKEKEMAQRLGWDDEVTAENMRSVGHINRGAHLQFKYVSSGTPGDRAMGYRMNETGKQDGGFHKVEDLGFTKRGKIRVQATGNRKVGKGSKKKAFTYQEPDSPINEVNPLLDALPKTTGLLIPPGDPGFIVSKATPAVSKATPAVKKKKFKINKAATPTHKMANGDTHTGKTHTKNSKIVKKAKPAIGPKPKVKRVYKMTKKDGKTKLVKKYKVGNTTY